MTTPVFPYLPGLSWPVQRAPVFDTTKQVAMSGRLTTFANAIQPTYKYTLTIDGLDSDARYPNLGSNSFQTLLGFYNQLLGGALAFNFFDVNDCLATAQPFGTGDGETTAFQLARALGGWADFIYSPLNSGSPITVPLLNGGQGNAAYSQPLIYVNGVLKTLTTDYTIGPTGVVTFTSAPAAAAALTWTGNYYWLCNMDEDSLEFSKIMTSTWEAKKISFTTRVF